MSPMNALEAYRRKEKLTYEALGAPAGYGRPLAWKHCRMAVIPGEAALRYHRAFYIPLADLRPDLYGDRRSGPVDQGQESKPMEAV